MPGFIRSLLGDWYSVPTLIMGVATVAFQIWMFVDAVRRGEYVWAVFIWIGSLVSTLLYFFMVYRDGSTATRGFQLPGTADRRRIKELQNQIHHLDKPHHHLALGDIYFQRGKLDQAEASYRAALVRDGDDPDIRAHLGQCLLRQGKPADARPLLERVAAANPRHEYSYTMMALAETLSALGDRDAALTRWRQVLENHAYARARVQFAELLIQSGDKETARHELQEVLSDDAHAPAFQRKRDKVWIRKAKKLLRSIL
ncbi:MAG TPA: tetratricopeptide repeat protein [Verrucomicrobiae bacterium]|jgi:hypothetical protein